jgi:hypothetical protein
MSSFDTLAGEDCCSVAVNVSVDILGATVFQIPLFSISVKGFATMTLSNTVTSPAALPQFQSQAVLLGTLPLVEARRISSVP